MPSRVPISDGQEERRILWVCAAEKSETWSSGEIADTPVVTSSTTHGKTKLNLSLIINN
jgi:hypothetical protein